YLDNSATTAVSPPVLALLWEMMAENYGNPSSLHRKGFLAEQAVAKARQQLAKVLSVRSDEVIFTSCGSESNNLAVLGAAHAHRHSGRRIVTTAVEHASVLAAVAALEQEGYEVVRLLPDHDGCVSPQAVADAVNDQTVLVSAMHVNSETGSVNDLAAIAAAVHAKNPKTLLHSDCVQSFCKLPVTPARWGIDLATVSGHKIHAPKGVAALYRRKGLRLLPLYYGSGQESGLHPGTENSPGIAAMGLAAELLWAEAPQNNLLYQELYQLLCGKIMDLPGACINSPKNSAHHIVNLSLPGLRSEVLIHFLEQFGIYLSSGSACAKGAKSHVLTAMGLPDAVIDSALRVSFCHDSTAAQVEELGNRLAEGYRTLTRSK
ncbi:MAG: cysteine desulfurase family protein, partial [Angelakisella sp.]